MAVIPRIGDTPSASSAVGTVGPDRSLSQAMSAIAGGAEVIGGQLAAKEREAERIADAKRREHQQYLDISEAEKRQMTALVELDKISTQVKEEEDRNPSGKAPERFKELAEEYTQTLFTKDNDAVNIKLATALPSLVASEYSQMQKWIVKRNTERTIENIFTVGSKLSEQLSSSGTQGDIGRAVKAIQLFSSAPTKQLYSLLGDNWQKKWYSDREDAVQSFIASMSEQDPIAAKNVLDGKAFSGMISAEKRLSLTGVVRQNQMRLEDNRKLQVQQQVYNLGGDLIKESYQGKLSIAQLAQTENELERQLAIADDVERTSITQQLNMIRTARTIASESGTPPLVDDKTLPKLARKVESLSEISDAKAGLKAAADVQEEILTALQDKKFSPTEAGKLQQAVNGQALAFAQQFPGGVKRFIKSIPTWFTGGSPKPTTDSVLQVLNTELGKNLSDAQRAAVYLDFYGNIGGVDVEAIPPEKALREARYSVIRALGMTPGVDGTYSNGFYTVKVKADGTWEDAAAK